MSETEFTPTLVPMTEEQIQAIIEANTGGKYLMEGMTLEEAKATLDELRGAIEGKGI